MEEYHIKEREPDGNLLGTYLNITVKMCKDVDKGGNQFKPNNVNGGKQM